MYEDGSIQVFEVSRGLGDIDAKLYQLSETNGEVALLQEADYKVGSTEGAIDISGKTEVDLSLLEYKTLSTPLTADSSTQSVLPKDMREATIGQEISLPSELVGTWTMVETPNGTKPRRPSSVEIAGDGSYASVYSDGNLIGNMMTLRKVSENGFVITSNGAQNGCFGIVGIGGNPGPNAKVEFGFIIEGQLLKNVSWTVTISAEDYSNPSVLATFTNPNFVVREEETASSSTSSSETKNSEEQVSEKNKNRKNYLVSCR